MNKEGTVWQIADEAVMLKAFRSGFGINQIARELGRSPSAVVTRLVRLHLLVALDDGYYPVVNPFKKANIK